MAHRIALRTILLFLCMSWFLGTNSISLAQTYDLDGDLYSREKRAEQVVEAVNRPPNIQGLTGLLIMNSAFTRRVGTLAVAASALGEDSKTPNYSVIQVPITLTYGITDTLEAGVKAKYINYAKNKEKGLGDSEVALKWRLNTHSTTFPELALGMVGMLPTGSDAKGTSKGINEVTDWGAKLMALASSETKILDNSFLGIYLEAQMVFIDGFSAGTKTSTQDRYGVLNAGLLLPISANNRFQAMLELSDTIKKTMGTTALAEGNQLGITPALRYVTDTLSITAGAQFLQKDTTGYKDTIRWTGTCSYQF